MGAIPSPTTSISAANASQALSETLTKHHKELIDNVYRQMVPLSLFSEEAEGSKPVTLLKNEPGATWSYPIIRGVLGDTQYTDSLGTYSTDVSKDLISSVHYFFPHAVVTPVTLDWEEVQNNLGSETQIVNIVKAYARAGVTDHATTLQRETYDVAGWNAVPGSELVRDRAKIIPLPVLIDNRGVVGQIDSNLAANAFWRSAVNVFDPATDDIADAIDELLMDIQFKTGEQPDVLLVGRKFRDLIRKWAMDHNYNIQDRKETQELNIRSFEFNGIVVTVDPNAPADTCLAINTTYLFEKVQNNSWFNQEERENPGNLTSTTVLFTRTQFFTNKRNAHGKLVVPAVLDEDDNVITPATVRPAGTPVAPEPGTPGAYDSVA